MSKKTKRSPIEVQRDRDALEAAGYTVVEKSPYHWHVRKQGSSILYNVWPTVGKYMRDGSGGSNHYKDIVQTLSGEQRHIEQFLENPAQREAQEEFYKYRRDPLAYIAMLTNH